MNGEWVQWILPIALTLITLIIGYLLGSKRQKKQTLQGHITKIAREEYPSLFDELRRNSEQLDNYLNHPFVTFNFPKLDQLYNRGLEEFIRKHHKDLFSAIDSFRNNILPKFKDFNSLGKESRIKVRDIWSNCLSKSLPREVAEVSNAIAQNLLTTMNPHNVLSLLLNGKDEETRNKIEGCILGNTHIYQKIAKRPFVIKGQTKVINYNEIYQALVDIAKPEIANIVDKHKELKKQNDNEVRGKLLPLLKKYISNPI